jgi:protein-disulfide isomerase
MKGFYLAVVAVLVIGIGWLVYQARNKPGQGAGLGAEEPVPAATDGFRGYTMGNDSARIQITEYSDFECPYCAAFATVQMPEVREQLIATGRVFWRYRDFPLSSHKWSRLAALAAQCAGEQGKFWDMHDQLFGHRDWVEQEKDPTDVFHGFAQAIGLDLARYDECVKSRRYAGRIQASLEEGQALHIQGTPTFFVNGRHFEGRATSDAFKAIVDSLSAARRKG